MSPCHKFSSKCHLILNSISLASRQTPNTIIIASTINCHIKQHAYKLCAWCMCMIRTSPQHHQIKQQGKGTHGIDTNAVSKNNYLLTFDLSWCWRGGRFAQLLRSKYTRTRYMYVNCWEHVQNCILDKNLAKTESKELLLKITIKIQTWWTNKKLRQAPFTCIYICIDIPAVGIVHCLHSCK